jgi:hypothetical protein
MKDAVADVRVQISQEEGAEARPGAPNLEHAKMAVLNSLTSWRSQQMRSAVGRRIPPGIQRQFLMDVLGADASQSVQFYICEIDAEKRWPDDPDAVLVGSWQDRRERGTPIVVVILGNVLLDRIENVKLFLRSNLSFRRSGQTSSSVPVNGSCRYSNRLEPTDCSCWLTGRECKVR